MCTPGACTTQPAALHAAWHATVEPLRAHTFLAVALLWCATRMATGCPSKLPLCTRPKEPQPMSAPAVHRQQAPAQHEGMRVGNAAQRRALWARRHAGTL